MKNKHLYILQYVHDEHVIYVMTEKKDTMYDVWAVLSMKQGK